MTAPIGFLIVPFTRPDAAASFAVIVEENADDAGDDLPVLALCRYDVLPCIVPRPHKIPASRKSSSVQTQKIAAVTVTYNRLNKLAVALEHTLAEELDYVVIVNNNSTDGTAVWLDSLTDSRIHVLHLTENSGGAGGFHERFKYINENLDVHWLVCFDDDAWPHIGAISKFRQLKLNSNVGAVTACVNLPSEKISEMNRPGYSPFRSFSSFLRTLLRGSKGFHIADDEYKSEILFP